MAKRQNPPATIEIDADYESQVSALQELAPGSAHDDAPAAGRRDLEPIRQQPPSYLPGNPAPVRKVGADKILQAAQTVNAGSRPDDAGAIRAMESLAEKSDPMTRAKGFGIVGAVLIAVIAVVSFAAYMAGMSSEMAWAMFGIWAMVVVLASYMRSEEFSPAGVERFKAKTYARIRLTEIGSDERVSLAKLDLLRDLQKELTSDEQ